MDYLLRAKEIEAELDTIRQTLHRHPEMGNKEVFTSAFIADYLKGLGIEVHRMLETAVVGILRGGKPGRKAALRADMDALPVTEETGCSFASEIPGVMHACGHDIHVTSALGAAKLLSEHRDTLCGDVVFLFQPDEEGNGGAERMIAEGALKGVTAAFGGHVAPDLPAGTVGIRYGKFYAASDEFTVKVHGVSCHGATPEKGVSSLLCASEMVQNLVKLKASSGDRTVVSVGSLHAGTAGNIIPALAAFSGIIRTLGPANRKEIKEKVLSLIEDTAKKYGATEEFIFTSSYDGVVNRDGETRLVEETARKLFGDDHVAIIREPNMTTEDFGYFIDAAGGGCFAHIGAGCTYPLHSPHFLPDIKAAVCASALYASVIASYLS